MKFGFNLLLWTTFVTENDLHLLSLLKEIGYDGVEIPTGDGPLEHYEWLAPIIAEHGLEVTSIAMALPDADPSSPDASIREAGLDRIKSRIECAHALGSPVLGGPLYAAHKTFSGQTPGEEEMKRAADILAAACDDAEQAGVTMCLEPLNRFEIALINTTEQARRLVDMVDHRRLQIHYDTHHAHYEENRHEAAIEIAGATLKHVHLSESHRGGLGTGLVDWPAVARGLKAIDYDAWCTVEAFSTKVDGIRQAANVHRDAFTSRESVVREALPFMRALTKDPS
jgi:D-psicose/D-tagatose/L-ribulose 3-epimerase